VNWNAELGAVESSCVGWVDLRAADVLGGVRSDPAVDVARQRATHDHACRSTGHLIAGQGVVIRTARSSLADDRLGDSFVEAGGRLHLERTSHLL
jgi:hypothetical protein